MDKIAEKAFFKSKPGTFTKEGQASEDLKKHDNARRAAADKKKTEEALRSVQEAINLGDTENAEELRKKTFKGLSAEEIEKTVNANDEKNL